MNTSVLFTVYGVVSSALVIFFLAKLANNFGYIDQPGGRKQHDISAAPVGGVAIFIVVAIGTVLSAPNYQDLYFLLAVGLLVVVGAVDEIRTIGVRYRIGIEFFASFIMAFGANIVLTHFGNLFGFGTVYLPFYLGLLFTSIAVFGTINAWNMMDGIDGLAGTMALLSIATFLIISIGHETLPVSVYLIFGGLLSFLLFNFSSGKSLPKVFLGDAGSKLIGFCLVWFMIRDTQGDGLDFRPATALFVMGLPIMDMTTTVLNRLRQGHSPFKPDRTHLHHVLMDVGYSRRNTYLIILVIAATLHLLGLYLHFNSVPGYIQFAAYWVFFLVYLVVVSAIKRDLRKSSLTQGVSCS